MLTLAQAEANKLYTIDNVQAEASTKQHLMDLGFVRGKDVRLLSYSKDNGVVLLHTSRIAVNVSILKQIKIIEKNGLEGQEWLSLDCLETGGTGSVIGIHGHGAIKRRLMDMGLTKGVKIMVRKVAPLGDPIEINLRGYELTLRKKEAELVLIQKERITVS